MSDIFSNLTEGHLHQNRTCRVAYTLNNTQPVLCTIIGDQPLFYMDYEAGYEDEEDLSFDAADLGILQGELDLLKTELDKFDTFSEEGALSSEEKISAFLDDVTSITDQKERSSDIADIVVLLEKSRLASAYLKEAEKHSIQIKYSTQIETSSYDRKNAQILINPSVDHVDQVSLLVQELRRHWQHRQGALIHPLMFHPDHAVLVNRVQVADLITSIVRVAWELQLSGEKDVWEALENSSMADLARAFAREAYLDFRTINNGQASAAVFEAWFLSERCRAQDKILINKMLADHKGYVFDMEVAEETVTANLIAALGEMPFGKNYLAEHAVTIMDDAIFTDVRDRSNANFLWFIKFERSFRETEQELQTQSHPSSLEGAGDIQSSGIHVKQQDEFDGTNTGKAGSAGEIVTLYSDEAHGDNSAKTGKRLSPKSRLSRTDGKGDASNVVYLRRWSGE